MRERRWHGGRTVPVPFRLGESTRAGFLARALVTSHRAREERKGKRRRARCRSPCPLTSLGAICTIGAIVVAVAIAVVCAATAAAADATVFAVYSAHQPHANIYERIQREASERTSCGAVRERRERRRTEERGGARLVDVQRVTRRDRLGRYVLLEHSVRS